MTGDPVLVQHERAYHRRAAAESTEVRETFGVGQILSIGIGIFFVVTGAIGLVRHGIQSLTAPNVRVVALSMTPLLALTHLAIGLVVLAGSSSARGARGVAMVLGSLLIGGGIVSLLGPMASLGWSGTNGVVYITSGGILLAGAVASPLVSIRRRRWLS